MPLPIILGIAAAAAAAAGVGAGIHGGIKMKEASDTMEGAKQFHERNVARFEQDNKVTTERMDAVGKSELEILNSFETFTTVFEKIQNKPQFKEIVLNGVKLPDYKAEELKNASVGAAVLLGGIGGAAVGTAGGIAAGGATTAAVVALGTASTGTAIASLSGAAATNAALAALGGGALAVGGGGMALGTAILGGATLGVGLLVGGVIFSITGSKLSEKADEAWNQANKAEKEISKICAYLTDLREETGRFYDALQRVNTIYKAHLDTLCSIVNTLGKTNWQDFTSEEQMTTENTVLLVGLLYQMCKTQLVLQTKQEGEPNQVNKADIAKAIAQSDEAVNQIKTAA